MKKSPGYTATISDVTVNENDTKCLVSTDDGKIFFGQEFHFASVPQNSIGKKVRIISDSRNQLKSILLEENGSEIYMRNVEKTDIYRKTKGDIWEVIHIIDEGYKEDFAKFAISCEKDDTLQETYRTVKGEIPEILQVHWGINEFPYSMNLNQMEHVERCYRVFYVIKSGFSDFNLPEAHDAAKEEYCKYLKIGKMVSGSKVGYNSYKQFRMDIEDVSAFLSSEGENYGGGDVYA